MEELDQQSEAIDDHLIKISSLDPTEEEDVSELMADYWTPSCVQVDLIVCLLYMLYLC